jgi:hypothetical protein
VCKNCFKDFSLFFAQKITEIVLYESERKVMDSYRFSQKEITSTTFEPLRRGARHPVKEIAFQFDIAVETITKFKLQKRENLNMKSGWLDMKNASV